MDSAAESLPFIENFFRRLGEHGIAYCILRNADEVARGDAHDIDMTVENARRREAVADLLAAAEQEGWKPQMFMGSVGDAVNIKCFNFYKQTASGLQLAHFDFFPTYSWNGYELLSNAELLAGADTEGLYRSPAPAVEAVTKLFIRLLFNGYIKTKYVPAVRAAFAAHREAALRCMGHFLSSAEAERVYADVIGDRTAAIEERRKSIIADIARTARRRKGSYRCYLLRKFLRRAAPIIAFQGTDGSGKSTIIENLPKLLANTYNEGLTHCYHWRPGFLIPEAKRNADGSVADASQPHAQKPRGFFGSLLRLGVFAADYILGYWCKAYVQAAKGHLVIFDRYYYDFYLDKQRYRMTMPNAVLRLVQCFIPEPDITFVLVGDAATIYARKKEIPQEEVQAQIDRLQALQHRFANPVTIDVNQPIPAVVNAVGTAIMEHLNRRHG